MSMYIRHLPILVALAGLMGPALVDAQVTGRDGLTLAGARTAIAAAVGAARRKQAPGGAIAVVDAGGHLLALERLDGTFAAAATVSTGKAHTAALFQRPTRVFEETIRKGRTPMIALDDFTPLVGGVPIVVAGRVVGAIGVSGAASAEQDDEIAVAGAAAVGGDTQAGAEIPVSYFPAREVEAAFAKGAVLLGEETGRNYMVHASRRDAAGQAEVHTLDTDIIHVLDGEATFVTGGTVIEAQTTAPNEIRGDAIRDGESRRLRAGDVIVVPNGTPHWFREVQAPFTYFVVKVR